MDQDKRQILSSTQRLPMLGKTAAGETKAARCRRCHKSLFLPVTLTLGHVRCQFCGELHRVGIPPQYARIVCECGKILTAPKKFAGQTGRCPGCHKVWVVPGEPVESRPKPEPLAVPEIADVTAPFVGPIRFKCSCGQPHIVEGERANTRIRCFRCGNELTVPVSQESTDAQPEEASISAAMPLPSPNPTLTETWYFQSPYPAEDLFGLLGVAPDTAVADVKKACRTIEAGIAREDPKFQKVQLAKDTLTKPESRLWYEVLRDDLKSLWQGSTAKGKWPALHDKAIARHKAAIALEQQRRYHKADRLWQQTLSDWLLLTRADPFWEALVGRGEALFGGKFSPDTAVTIRHQLLEKVVIAVACQFRERYLAEYDLRRAHLHVRQLAPILRYRWDTDPGDVYSKNLFITYLTVEIRALADAGRYKKIFPLLLQLNDIAPENTEVRRLIEEMSPLLAPFLSARQRQFFRG